MASKWRNLIERISALAAERPFIRELLIFTVFVLLTSLMIWPWVIHLRDACADTGDPYLHSWVMWWDFHQTFHDPLHLFNGTIFYPLPDTLAFTENDYGIALLFFPLYAIGLTPLTVNSIATFLGFAFSGYGAFRLTRTLTASNTAAWIAGIVFAFIPYRLHVLSQLTYVFSGWMPLLLEALVLFARVRSRKRAAWLGVAFTMNALSSLTWMSLSLVPLTITALLLIVNHRLWRDRDFWFRGAAAAVASMVVLFPFLLPYFQVSRRYGFSWGPEIVARNSPTAFNWLVAEDRLSLWKGLGSHLNTSGARLFTGLTAPLLALCALFGRRAQDERWSRVSRLLLLFDAAAIGAALSSHQRRVNIHSKARERDKRPLAANTDSASTARRHGGCAHVLPGYS